MYSLVTYKIVYPNFPIQQIATPISTAVGSNNPIYNTTSLQIIPIVELPAGGQYTFEFDTDTFLQLTLDTFTIQQTDIYPSEINQDSYYQQSYIGNQPLTSALQVRGFQVTRQTTEKLYIQGNSFTIDTSQLSQSQVVTISLPTFIQMQVGLEANNPLYNTNVEMAYPTSSFYTNPNVINPQNWNIVSPFGIEYNVSVSQVNGVMYTIGFDIPDLFGNFPEFTINGENLPNSVFNSTPTITGDYVPELPVSQFSNINPMQMVPGGSYNYGSFTSLGYADGLIANYPVYLKEQISYGGGAVNSNRQPVYAYLKAISLRGGTNGIKLYGLLLGAFPVSGYEQPLMINNFLIPAQNTNVAQTLQSNAQILPTLLSSSTSSVSISTVSSSSSSSTASSSSSTSSSTSTTTTTTTSQTTTTSTNVNKTSISLTNLFTSPLAVLIIILALIGVVIFVTV